MSMASTKQSGSAPRDPNRESPAHEAANLIALPTLAVLSLLGILQLLDPMVATVACTVYTLGDYIWIWLQPDAVPANRTVRTAILVHHIVTLALLAFPLRYPALRVFACWDTLAEVNTYLRILRRVLFPRWQRLVGALYWSTFVAFRGILYPYLLVRFYYEMQAYSFWQLLTVCGCQLFLVGFNIGILVLNFLEWRKKAAAAAAAAQLPGSTPAGAPSQQEAHTAATDAAGAQLKPSSEDTNGRLLGEGSQVEPTSPQQQRGGLSVEAGALRASRSPLSSGAMGQIAGRCRLRHTRSVHMHRHPSISAPLARPAVQLAAQAAGTRRAFMQANMPRRGVGAFLA